MTSTKFDLLELVEQIVSKLPKGNYSNLDDISIRRACRQALIEAKIIFSGDQLNQLVQAVDERLEQLQFLSEEARRQAAVEQRRLDEEANYHTNPPFDGFRLAPPVDED